MVVSHVVKEKNQCAVNSDKRLRCMFVLLIAHYQNPGLSPRQTLSVIVMRTILKLFLLFI